MTVHVLVGTSPTDAARRVELTAQAQQHGAQLAFLQLASPSLTATLERLAREGVRKIVLVGVSGGIVGPGVSWLRRIASDWWRQHGDPTLEIGTARAFLQDDSQWSALVAQARPITHGGPGLRSDAWHDVPSHRHQVFVCRGPRCSAAGAEGTADAVTLALMRAGLGDDDVLVTQTGCQFPCNHAPLVTVQPGDVWYGSVGVDDVDEIVSEHLIGDRTVERLRLPRAPH